MPGFNDAHDHPAFPAPVRLAFSTEFSVPGISKTALLDSVTRLVLGAPPCEWISGTIGVTIFNDSTIRHALDSIAPNNPVCLQNMWGHGLLLNTKALKMVGIAEDEPDPLGGWYLRNNGTRAITGALYEYAQWPVWQALAAAASTGLAEWLTDYSNQQIERGITSVQYMSYDFPDLHPHYLRAKVQQRMRLIPFPGTTKTGRSLDDWKDIKPYQSPLISVSGIKYLVDGTPIEAGALNKHPYHGTKLWFGKMNMPVDTIKQILHEAYTSNTQLLLHIVGDSTLAIVLELMKAIGHDSVWKTKRVRFEHNATDNATTQELQSIRNKGIIMAHTPKYGQGGRLQSLLSQNIIVSVSPDGTVNPFLDIMMMTTTQKKHGENITVEDAVIAYTLTNAYAEFAEKKKGKLIPGMLADLAVLNQDIFTIPKEQLPSTKSVLTMVGGVVVYAE